MLFWICISTNILCWGKIKTLNLTFAFISFLLFSISVKRENTKKLGKKQKLGRSPAPLSFSPLPLTRSSPLEAQPMLAFYLYLLLPHPSPFSTSQTPRPRHSRRHPGSGLPHKKTSRGASPPNPTSPLLSLSAANSSLFLPFLSCFFPRRKHPKPPPSPAGGDRRHGARVGVGEHVDDEHMLEQERKPIDYMRERSRSRPRSSSFIYVRP